MYFLPSDPIAKRIGIEGLSEDSWNQWLGVKVVHSPIRNSSQSKEYEYL